MAGVRVWRMVGISSGKGREWDEERRLGKKTSLVTDMEISP
jgi:hypothetical protein